MGEHMLTKGEKFPSFSLENQDGAVVTNETLKDVRQYYIFILETIHQLAQLKHATLEITYLNLMI